MNYKVSFQLRNSNEMHIDQRIRSRQFKDQAGRASLCSTTKFFSSELELSTHLESRIGHGTFWGISFQFWRLIMVANSWLMTLLRWRQICSKVSSIEINTRSSKKCLNVTLKKYEFLSPFLSIDSLRKLKYVFFFIFYLSNNLPGLLVWNDRL